MALPPHNSAAMPTSRATHAGLGRPAALQKPSVRLIPVAIPSRLVPLAAARGGLGARPRRLDWSCAASPSACRLCRQRPLGPAARPLVSAPKDRPLASGRGECGSAAGSARCSGLLLLALLVVGLPAREEGRGLPWLLALATLPRRGCSIPSAQTLVGFPPVAAGPSAGGSRC